MSNIVSSYLIALDVAKGLWLFNVFLHQKTC